MQRKVWHPGKVIWSGENPFMRLRRGDKEDVTRLSFFRVVWSPHGEGHALFILTDAATDTANYPLAAQFTDNPPMCQWLYDTLFRSEFWRSRTFRTINARFSHHGDTRHERIESVVSADYRIELKWLDLREPAGYCIHDAEKQNEFDLYSIVIPAGRAEVHVNGRKAQGEPFTQDFGGRPETTCCLAFSETWVRPPL